MSSLWIRKSSSSPVSSFTSSSSSFVRLLNYLMQSRSLFFLGVGMALASSLCLVASPWLIGHLIDVVASGKISHQLALGCGLLALSFSASAFFSWAQAHTVARLSQMTVTHIRGDYFAHLQRLPVRFFLAPSPR